MIISARWLEPRPELSRDFREVHIDEVHKTRVEEFTFVRDTLLDTWNVNEIMDAGTGFAVGAHMLPYILGDCGYQVYAVDKDPRTLEMPEHESVSRILADICDLMIPGDCVDAWVCVSVLEHLTSEQVGQALDEGYRMLRPGGLAIVTMDNASPEKLTALLQEHDFAVGSPDPTEPDTPLSPPVGAIVAMRPL